VREQLSNSSFSVEAEGEVCPQARRLNIVSVCRTLPTSDDPAAGTFVASRLAALAQLSSLRVIQPVPFFPFAKPLPRWVKAGQLASEPLRIEPAPMFYMPGVLKSLDSMWLARSVRRKIVLIQRDSPVDLIDAHFGYPDGVGSVRVAKALGLPAFVTIRGSETDFLRTPGIGPQLVHSLNAATGCVSVSHSLRRLVVEHGVDGERVRVIPNAVDRKVFGPASKEAARQLLGLDATTRLIVSVGHLISGKRHDILVRALIGLRRRHPAATLAIVGGPAYDRAYPAELARVVREAGVGQYVKILGRVRQSLVSSWLQAADVFALATQREGCCNSVLEALAAGRPVVTTPVGDNPDFVHNGVNGSLVPVGDVPAFERALADALERKWDAHAISRGLDVGDWNDVAQRVVDFFTERLAESAIGRAPNG
jgi:glycosyltransferase involved in cell wall biosynthesis